MQARGMTIETDLSAKSREVLAQHGKSFSWAAFWLPRAERDAGSVVYAFCRAVDDAVDEGASRADAERELAHVRSMLAGERPATALVAAYRAIVETNGVGLRPAEELLDGMASDLGSVRIENDRELLRYCYRVAGTVGRMMCGVLGATSRRAVPYAVDLGIAMQLTNICRDVLEDAERGRVYLPRARLVAVGLEPDDLLDERRRASEWVQSGVSVVVGDLLALAERFYEVASLGYSYLPGRGRLAAMLAGTYYRAIGHRLRRRGANPLAGRVFIGPPAKALLLLGTLSRWTLDWILPRALGRTVRTSTS